MARIVEALPEIEMPAPRRDEIEPCLRRLEPALNRIVLGAWDEWLESGQVGLVQFPRTRANLVWDYMVRRAREEFADTPGIVVIDRHDTVLFLCDDRVLFRFKKGDEAGLSRNYPTPLALTYHDHDRNLFGLPEVERVEVVYVLNLLQTAIQSVMVVGRDGSDIVWAYDILNRGEAAVADLLPAAPPPPTSTEHLVKPRVPGTEEQKEAE